MVSQTHLLRSGCPVITTMPLRIFQLCAESNTGRLWVRGADAQAQDLVSYTALLYCQDVSGKPYFTAKSGRMVLEQRSVSREIAHKPRDLRLDPSVKIELPTIPAPGSGDRQVPEVW